MGSEGTKGAGAGEVPGETGYVSYILLCYVRSLQMINLVMRFIIKLICERTEACRLR